MSDFRPPRSVLLGAFFLLFALPSANPSECSSWFESMEALLSSIVPPRLTEISPSRQSPISLLFKAPTSLCCGFLETQESFFSLEALILVGIERPEELEQPQSSRPWRLRRRRGRGWGAREWVRLHRRRGFASGWGIVLALCFNIRSSVIWYVSWFSSLIVEVRME